MVGVTRRELNSLPRIAHGSLIKKASERSPAEFAVILLRSNCGAADARPLVSATSSRGKNERYPFALKTFDEDQAYAAG
jgi:hypothetical protein